jgi:histidinol-phosphate/aromatic aminotransferase/cobyric acid decarboxylase-like protein
MLVFLQHENEKALQKLKEAQAEAREQSRIMTEENAMLAAQLAKLQNFAIDHQSSNFFLCPISAEDALHDAHPRSKTQGTTCSCRLLPHFLFHD